MSIWLPSRASSLTAPLRPTAYAIKGSFCASVILPSLLLRNAHVGASTTKTRRITPTIPAARCYASSSSAEENKRSFALAPKDNPAEASASSSVPSKAAEPRQPFVTRAWAKVKHEVNHYWDGTKLLGKEIKISWRLLRRLLKGKQLTRRERRQVGGGSMLHP
jgi:LETM1 and EF-hand domain-containing protein 1